MRRKKNTYAPHGGALFCRVRGAVGFTVLAGIALVVGAADGLLLRKG